MKFNLFQGKSVVVTGHTGFKGSWLIAWLTELGASVTGISLGIPSEPSHYMAASLSQFVTSINLDVRSQSELQEAILSAQPDFVFHLAAQALVRRSYDDPSETWSTNVLGTLNVLEALRYLDKACCAVFITSDKCYDNVEWVWGYRETDKLGGPDPYSASKGAAELVINSYVKSFFSASPVRIASARAGNVIGGSDWGDNRIVPDCFRAWSCDLPVDIRNPHSTRPWQHVLEPLSGYLTLAISLFKDSTLHGQSFNFGPSSLSNNSVLELVNELSKYWKGFRLNNVPDNSGGPYESTLLKLNCDKALHMLNWHSVWSFEETLRFTAEWYLLYRTQPSAIFNITKSHIHSYVAQATSQNLYWTSL